MVVRRRGYEDGKVVFAKWPGSGYYYKAEILDFNDEENLYSVKFSEGDESIYQLTSRDMFAEKRGTAKTVKKRRKSRGRSRSRSRSTSRSRNNGRRRSESPDLDHKSSRERGRSPEIREKKVVRNELSVESVDIHKVPSEKFAAMTNVENRSMDDLNHIAEILVNNVDTKVFEASVTPIRLNKREETISNQDWLSNSVTKKQDKNDLPKLSFITTLFSMIFYVIHNFALVFSCLVTLLLPVIFICGLYISCDRENCSLLIPPVVPSVYGLLEKKSLTYVFGWYLLQTVLAALPIGRVTKGPKKSDIVYRMNGGISLFLSIIIVGILMHYLKFPFQLVSEDYMSLIGATFLFVLVASLVVFIISRNNAEEPTGGFLQDFVYGRVDHPTLFGFDLKTAAFKAGFISWAVLNLVYLKNALSEPGEKNLSLILLVSFQMWYVFDHMVFEETNLYTPSISSEKIGFTGLCGMLLFSPLFGSFQARFLSLHQQSVPWNFYILPVILKVSGYLVYRSSVLEKFNFERNPHRAKRSGAIYIPTSSGKDILVNGWWGIVRHPNYLGDLLMNLSWALLCGFSHFLPWIWVISLAISLMCLAWKKDSLSLQEYGKGWLEYRDEVKYRLIPFVY